MKMEMKVKLLPTLWVTTTLCATSLWALNSAPSFLRPHFCALISAPSFLRPHFCALISAPHCKQCLQLFSATEVRVGLMWVGGSLKSMQFCMGCFSILTCTGCNFDRDAEKKRQ
ncbi:hypothetical protein F5Y17DRAFT_344619 [Xylariaceae sp. FL0594]|nr:hypothetical protein F5Y17DRAFT_344619 [Xylariaceae sp. FL0594]